MKKQKRLSIKIITLFPQFIEGFAESFGIIQKAIQGKLLDIKPIDLRAFGLGERQIVDDRPYGGGVGMVLRADVMLAAINFARRGRSLLRQGSGGQARPARTRQKVIMLTPQGKRFEQKDAQRLAKYDNLIFVCGRYEGFDERIRSYVDEELSIGDYVLMGGELPALVISEAVMRLRPGILGKLESTDKESFSEAMLEYPQYTKPEVLTIKIQEPRSKLGASRGRSRPARTEDGRSKILRVPKVLLSGNHQKVEEFRREEALKRTKKRRPDLLKNDKNDMNAKITKN